MVCVSLYINNCAVRFYVLAFRQWLVLNIVDSPMLYGQTSMNNDASPVATTDEFRFRDDMHNAPRGKKLLLLNEGGVLVTGVLNSENTEHFIEWQYIPKRAKRKKVRK